MTKSNSFEAVFDKKRGTLLHLWDKRYQEPIDVTDGSGRFGSVSYTLCSDDITVGNKPLYTPYVSRSGYYHHEEEQQDDVVWENSSLATVIRYRFTQYGLMIEAQTQNHEISEFGINLTLNFMSKKFGRWQEQYLVSSPYVSSQGQYSFCYFTKPDGKNLLIVAETQVDGFKIDYSSYNSGHFIENFKYLSSFDKAYHSAFNKEGKHLKLHIIPVDTYENALHRVSDIFHVPVAYYEVSSGFEGQAVPVRIIGDCDKVISVAPNSQTDCLQKQDKNRFTCLLQQCGLYRVIPMLNGAKGLDCTLFCIEEWAHFYKKVTFSVHQNREQTFKQADGTEHWLPPGNIYIGNENNPDRNLCESQMWASSALRYMRLYGYDDTIACDVKNLLYFMTVQNPQSYLGRLTMVSHPQGEMCAYNTFQSTRIQETFNGVSILLDAYELFHQDEYLEFAVNAMLCMIAHCVMETGEIRRFFYGEDAHHEDYTTVTCLVFPIVQLANVLKAQGDVRYHIFEAAAVKTADFLVDRGLCFPTEGEATDLTNPEMEDGSISCTALSVLYVARYVCPKGEYIRFAEQILKTHDAWRMHTRDARMYGSSLRWWETIWEGDFNGPALCCGHAWTIWRAEAQFHYAMLTKDTTRLIDSYNGYMSNFSQTDQQGNMYAIYQCDDISGGGNVTKAEDVSFKITRGYPFKADNSLSRYVFVRAYETWFCCTALIRKEGWNYVLNGSITHENEVWKLESYAPRFSILYVDGFQGEICLQTQRAVVITASSPVRVTRGVTVGTTELGATVMPPPGESLLCIQI